MTHTLDFPGLGLSFELNRVAFSVFGQPVFWYGLIIGLAFAAAAFYYIKRVKEFGLDGDRMIDVLILTALGGVIGVRLYHVIFSWEMYRHNLLGIFNLREGGLAIYGGIAGGVLFAYLACKWRGVKFLPLLDLFASGMLLAQGIGRWGNFVNIEAFGSNTTAPWGMTSPVITSYLIHYQERLAALGMMVDPHMPVHPTFLYESLWNFAGFALIALYIKKRKFDGEIFLIYLGWYGLGRAVIEGMRTDSLMLGNWRISQVVAVLCVIASAAALAVIHSRIRKSNDPSYLRLYVHTVEGGATPGGAMVGSVYIPPRIHDWRRGLEKGRRSQIAQLKAGAKTYKTRSRARKR